jgi:hypothetical protein
MSPSESDRKRASAMRLSLDPEKIGAGPAYRLARRRNPFEDAFLCSANRVSDGDLVSFGDDFSHGHMKIREAGEKPVHALLQSRVG